MSRSRKKESPPDSPAHTDSAPTANTTASTGRGKTLALAVFSLAAIWYVALISLAAFTGNPVTINRQQIQQSDLVVAGTVDEAGTVSHILVFKGIAPEGEIRIDAFSWPAGEYILPLKRVDGKLQVTLTELPDNPPLIYPSNDKSIEQLQQILK